MFTPTPWARIRQRGIWLTGLLRFITAFQITALLLPIWLMNPEVLRAGPSSAAIRHGSAPADFVTYEPPGTSIAIPGALASFTKAALAFLTPATEPEGIRVPNPRSPSERLASSIRNIPSAVAKLAEPNTAPEPMPTPAAAVSFDYTGDGKADLARWHSDTTEFKYKNSTGGSYTTVSLGSSASIPAPADYDGDGKTDAAMFNAGSWSIRKSSTNTTVTVSWGTTGDIPVSGDYS